jgi:hypothetical protein
LLRAAFVCPVPDSEIEPGTKGGVASLPVPGDAIDLISSLFDGHRSADPGDTRFAFAFAQPEFPSPAISFSQLNNRVLHSLVFHQNSSAGERRDILQNNGVVCPLVYLTIGSLGTMALAQSAPDPSNSPGSLSLKIGLPIASYREALRSILISKICPA